MTNPIEQEIAAEAAKVDAAIGKEAASLVSHNARIVAIILGVIVLVAIVALIW